MPTNDKQDLPIDRGYAWVIVLAFFTSIFAQAGIGKSFGIFLEEFIEHFNVPVATATMIGSISGGVFTVVAPISILAGEHFTQRKVVMFGGLIGGLGFTLSSFMFNIEWVIFTFGAVAGFGNACLLGNGTVMLGRYFKERRSLAMALAMAGGSVGLFAFPPFLQYLLDTYALKGTLLISGALFLNQMVSGSLYRPLTFYTNRQKRTTEEMETFIKLEKDSDTKHSADMVVKDNTDRTSSLKNGHLLEGNGSQTVERKDSSLSKVKLFLKNMFDFSVLRNYVVIMFLIVIFLVFFGNINFLIFMPPSATGKGISKFDRAWLISINGIGDLIGRLSVGVVGDRNIIPRYKILSVTSGLCGISILCYSFTSTFWVMCVFVSLYGFFTGCYIANNTPTLIDLVGIELMAKVLALTMFISGLGVTIGQPMLGAIRDATGDYQIVHYINSACMVLGAIVLYTYPAVKAMEDKRLGDKKHTDDKLETNTIQA